MNLYALQTVVMVGRLANLPSFGWSHICTRLVISAVSLFQMHILEMGSTSAIVD